MVALGRCLVFGWLRTKWLLKQFVVHMYLIGATMAYGLWPQFCGCWAAAPICGCLEVPKITPKKVHVGVPYISGPYRGCYITTLRPKCVLEPLWGHSSVCRKLPCPTQTQDLRKSARAVTPLPFPLFLNSPEFRDMPQTMRIPYTTGLKNF